MLTIYIIGAPGAGKTTVSQALTNRWRHLGDEPHPVKHRRFSDNTNDIIALGWHKPPFSGTDTLPYTVIETIENWLPDIDADIVIGEGDRLANNRFMELAEACGDLWLFYLDTNPAVATDRRQLRADQAKTKQQNPTWVAGRVTKHRNLAERHEAITIPGNLTPDQAANFILATVFA
jgi:shikimate kinase